MRATFSTADWRGAALEIADALVVLARSLTPAPTNAEANAILQNAIGRLSGAMHAKRVPPPTIENTIGLLAAAFERRLNVLVSRLGAECEPGQVQMCPRRTAV